MTREQAHKLRHTIASRLQAEAIRILDHRTPLEEWDGLTSYGSPANGTVEPLDVAARYYTLGAEDGEDVQLAIVIQIADSGDVTAEGEL